MTSSAPSPEIYSSPKRKRGEPHSITYSPHTSPRTSRILTNLSEYPFAERLEERCDRIQDSSPSSKVTGQLRTLDLEGTFVRQIAFTDAGHTKKRWAQSGEQQSPHEAERPSREDQCPSPPLEPANNVVPSNPPFEPGASSFPSAILDRPRAHSRSPPFDGDPEDNPMTWHESEITGHNPTDPNDDGYGINGIGFKPTPAIAWARSQKRKQQLLDYRNREAREARQRRSERRSGGSVESSAEGAEVGKKGAKVRFGDID